MPSSGLGCPSGSQPGAPVPQDKAGGHDVASWKKIEVIYNKRESVYYGAYCKPPNISPPEYKHPCLQHDSSTLERPTLGAKVAVIMCNIVRHWQFSKKSSMRHWAKLGDIRRN